MYKSKIGHALLILCLSACAENNNKSQSPETAPAGSAQGKTADLQACLNEADALVKMSNKHINEVNSLYRLIKDAKYYSSISGKISEKTRVTITPYYEFRVYDFCNKISQSMLTELKSGDSSDMNRESNIK
ncbi:hypothetical protein OVA10_23365 [Lelliottia sp. SL45]|uniref:hypothetical protein n=1 Tax=Lelliottia sp. SL45 TaxID=2994665 RepID=UPI0022724865|nr:hypothetical protein [Lelliottia sp. SL45]MCY1700954.1 hypothetical protein [Lelliottia sp. SL45]